MRALKFGVGFGLVLTLALLANGSGSNPKPAYGFIPAAEGECVKMDNPTYAMGVPPEYKGPKWPSTAEAALAQVVGSEKAAAMSKRNVSESHAIFELTEDGKVVEYVDLKKTELGWAVHERATKIPCPSGT